MSIYTHDEAARIVEKFEDVLAEYCIHVPSPEDDEREEENMVGLYGSTYWCLLDDVEEMLIDILDRKKSGENVVSGIFSGTM